MESIKELPRLMQKGDAEELKRLMEAEYGEPVIQSDQPDSSS